MEIQGSRADSPAHSKLWVHSNMIAIELRAKGEALNSDLLEMFETPRVFVPRHNYASTNPQHYGKRTWWYSSSLLSKSLIG
jgi:hypothetical protein